MSTPTSALPSILFVDDEPDHLFPTRRLLVKAAVSHPLVEATDGRQAIDCLSLCCTAGGASDLALPPSFSSI